MKKQQGFTLIEVLLGLVLTVVVIGAGSMLFSSSNKLYGIQADNADEEQALAAGLAQMSYELGLAGYRGTDLTAENIGTRNFNGLPTIKIEQHDDSDEIIVRYYEDQWISGTTPQLKEVRFYTNDDYLWRREGNDYARTVAKDVESVKVAYWLNKYGTRIPLLSNLDRTVARGLVIKLKFKDRGEELFTVAFQNQQRN